MGLVAWVKKLGLAGNILIVVSMAIGLVFGLGYQAMAGGFPDNFAGWFAYVVYGIGLGIVASGVYDAGKGIVEKLSQ
jgi:hypothetical protein